MLAARQARGGVIARKSGPSSTSAPTLRSSLAIAARRSVSLTRQLAMLRRVDGPSAKRARAASVIAASGMGLQSRSIAASGQRPRRTSSQPLPDSMLAPIARTASAKAMSPWIEPLSMPSMRSGASTAPIAAAAMKYDADDASPSTSKRPGERSGWPAPRR